ncbi:MAG: PorV/PorQ family protein [Candidatus Eisenbacteria bacterium]
MRRTKSRCLPLCVLALLVAGLVVLSGARPAFSEEFTGLAFLKIGVGARAAAMGSAHLAVASDATSIYWNPAGLAAVEGLNLHLSHNEWLQDIRYEFLAVAKKWGSHGIGAGFSGLYMGELERRDVSGTFLGHFGSYDIAAWAGWGTRVAPDFSLGVSGKFLAEQIDDATATGFAVDLGAKYDTPVERLSVAAGVFNLGPKMKFDTEEFDIPRSIACGASYVLPVEEWTGSFLFAADLVSYKGEDPKVHVGAEYGFRGMASLAAGYKFGYDVEGFSVGAGFRRGTLSAGYAYSALGSELGDAHRISLSYDLR